MQVGEAKGFEFALRINAVEIDVVQGHVLDRDIRG